MVNESATPTTIGITKLNNEQLVQAIITHQQEAIPTATTFKISFEETEALTTSSEQLGGRRTWIEKL